MSSFKAEKYDEKVVTYRELRRSAPALAVTLRNRRRIEEWDPSSLKGETIDLEKQTNLDHDIGGLVNYYENKNSDALDLICQDSFRIVYQIHYDIERDAVLGQNTATVNVDVKWEKQEVSIKLYPGVLRPATTREKLTAAIREGIPNRDDVAKVTGWNRATVQTLSDAQMSQLRMILEHVRSGQQKITRLVKGMLLMLHCMDNGAHETLQNVQHPVVYGPMAIINAGNQPNRGFVYNSCPSSAVHTAVLNIMCGAYPPPDIQSHVTVPADGQTIHMISQGNVPVSQRVRLTPTLVYSSIMRYAMDLGITDDIQSALIIACSLSQNRYLSEVELPAVVSTMDLLVPGFVIPTAQMNKPNITKELARSIGRLHQMMAFTISRDIITSATLTTRDNFSPFPGIKSYLSAYDRVVLKKGRGYSNLKILEAAPQFRFLGLMDEATCGDLASISILEGLWLCEDAVNAAKNGAVSLLKNGTVDLSDETSSYDVLLDELRAANVTFDKGKLPTGSYSVSWVNVTPSVRRVVKQKRFVTRPANLVQECEFDPNNALKKVRKPRIGTRAPEPVKETRVPLKLVKHVRQRTESSEKPPSYGTTETSVSSRAYEDAYDQTTLAHEAARRVGAFPVSPVLGKRRVNKVVRDKGNQLTEAERTVELLVEDGNARSDAEDAVAFLSRQGMLQEFIAVKDIGVVLSKISEVAMVTPPSDPGPLSSAIRVAIIQLSRPKAIDKLHREGVDDVAAESLWKMAVQLANTRQLILQPVEKYVKMQIDRGIHHLGFKLEGDSELIASLNDSIDKGSLYSMSTGAIADMYKLKSQWEGDVHAAPREGLVYVAFSKAWEDFVESNDVRANEETASGKSMRLVVAEFMKRYPDVPLRMMQHIAEWAKDTTIQLWPKHLDEGGVSSWGKPYELPWLSAPTSLEYREVSVGDSKWLVLAAMQSRGAYDRVDIGKLLNWFYVDPMMQRQLSQHGIFKYNVVKEEGKSQRK